MLLSIHFLLSYFYDILHVLRIQNIFTKELDILLFSRFSLFFHHIDTFCKEVLKAILLLICSQTGNLLRF